MSNFNQHLHVPDDLSIQLQQPTAVTMEERVRQLTELAEKQQRQMEDANVFANGQTLQLQESQRQLAEAQQMVLNLTTAFQALSTQQRPITSAPKKSCKCFAPASASETYISLCLRR